MPRISTVTTPLLELLDELELLEEPELLEELELLDELELLEELKPLEEVELPEELELLDELELTPGSFGALPELPPLLEQAPSSNAKISISIGLMKGKDDLETLMSKSLR